MDLQKKFESSCKRRRDWEVDLTDPVLCKRDDTGPEGPSDSSFMTWEDVAFETDGLIDGVPFVDPKTSASDPVALADMARWYEQAERELVEQGKLLPIRHVEPDPAMERACRFAVPRALERMGYHVDPVNERASVPKESRVDGTEDDAAAISDADNTSGWIWDTVCSCATLREWSSPDDVRVAEWAVVKQTVARVFPSMASEMLQRVREECEARPRREHKGFSIHLGYHKDQQRVGLRLSVDRGDGRRRVVWGFRVKSNA